jgi:hypothetical protein
MGTSWSRKMLESAGLMVALFLGCVAGSSLLPASWLQLGASEAELPRWVYVALILLSLAAVAGALMLAVGVGARPGSVNRVALQLGLASGVVATVGLLLPYLLFTDNFTTWELKVAACGLGILPIVAAWSVWLRHRSTIAMSNRGHS